MQNWERGYQGDGIKGHPEQTYETLQTGTVVTEMLSYKLSCTPVNREELEAQVSLLCSGETNHLYQPVLTEKEFKLLTTEMNKIEGSRVIKSDYLMQRWDQKKKKKEEECENQVAVVQNKGYSTTKFSKKILWKGSATSHSVSKWWDFDHMRIKRHKYLFQTKSRLIFQLSQVF